MIPGIPGAHSQAATLDELKINIKEVLELCLEAQDLEVVIHGAGTQHLF